MTGLRWIEVFLLRIAYFVIQLLVTQKRAVGMVRRRILMFTTIVLAGIALVMAAAIPVSYYLLGQNLEAVAAVKVEPNSGQIAGKDSENQTSLVDSENQGQVIDTSSPFVSLTSEGETGNVEATEEVAAAKPQIEPTANGEAAPKETALEHAGKHADPTFVCPMHPEITSKNPDDTCPICGMKLVPLESSGAEGNVVTISSAVINNLGVRTTEVKRKTLYRRINSVGYIAENENKIRSINLRTEAWIERLAVKSVGARVKKGDLLFEIYSPNLTTAQEEYLEALESNNMALADASKQRLVALGISPQQIEEIASNRKADHFVRIYAPQNGIISELAVREGQYVMPAEAVINLVDLSSVWLVADIFERQSNWVKVGQKATATLPFMPDKEWTGQVEYIYPTLDPKTRSLKVRLRFDNAEELLKPNMYADVSVFANPKKDALAMPREALIRTGDEQRVIVAIGEGKFAPMTVRTGIETDDQVEILAGLNPGDKVVVSSQFLIDSESSVKAALMRMGNQ